MHFEEGRRELLRGEIGQWHQKGGNIFSGNRKYICVIKNKYYLCSRKGRTESSQQSEERWQSGRLRRS